MRSLFFFRKQQQQQPVPPSSFFPVALPASTCPTIHTCTGKPTEHKYKSLHVESVDQTDFMHFKTFCSGNMEANKSHLIRQASCFFFYVSSDATLHHNCFCQTSVSSVLIITIFFFTRVNIKTPWNFLTSVYDSSDFDFSLVVLSFSWNPSDIISVI